MFNNSNVSCESSAKLQTNECNAKDRVKFVNKEDIQKPSTVNIPKEEFEHGGINPDGSINWECPCLGSGRKVFGPCGVQYREALTCFFETPDYLLRFKKCVPLMEEANGCMAKYPTLFNDDEGNDSTAKNKNQNVNVKTHMYRGYNYWY